MLDTPKTAASKQGPLISLFIVGRRKKEGNGIDAVAQVLWSEMLSFKYVA
jgi:hypothetical protein